MTSTPLTITPATEDKLIILPQRVFIIGSMSFCVPIFAQLVIFLKLVLAGLRLGLKNRQMGEKWVSDDCSYLCKGL
jgi:hypothetical protein